jgi:hypothetical protein
VTCEATHPFMQCKAQSVQNFMRAIDWVEATERKEEPCVHWGLCNRIAAGNPANNLGCDSFNGLGFVVGFLKLDANGLTLLTSWFDLGSTH